MLCSLTQKRQKGPVNAQLWQCLSYCIYFSSSIFLFFISIFIYNALLFCCLPIWYNTSVGIITNVSFLIRVWLPLHVRNNRRRIELAKYSRSFNLQIKETQMYVSHCLETLACDRMWNCHSIVAADSKRGTRADADTRRLSKDKVY